MLSIWLFFAFCNRPSVAAIPVLKMQGLHLLINILGIILRVAALLVGFIVFNNPLLAIMFFSIVYAIMNIVLISITIARSKMS